MGTNTHTDRFSLGIVAGARPNFMKIAPIIRAIEARPEVFRYDLVHTGQHYDFQMSDVFFEELAIPRPDRFLDCGSGTHAEQTAKILIGMERYCVEAKPDLIIVVGDVNSTLAASISAKKLYIPVAHVEAGLRSGDLRMPEEINRIVTDAISDLFFVTEAAATANLLREGKAREQIFFVGHVMVDNLYYQKAKLDVLPDGERRKLESAAIKTRWPRYGAVTLHRPSNVDGDESLRRIIGALNEICARLPLVFPAHPRTHKRLDQLRLALHPDLLVTAPLSYMDFLNLWKDAEVVITDSGGLQEETTALGVPCITVRDTTERPITVEVGTNILVGSDTGKLVAETAALLDGRRKTGRIPDLWDGHAAVRIVDTLATWLAARKRPAPPP